MEAILSSVEAQLGEAIVSHRSVSGGDINDAYFLSSESKDYFLKANSIASASAMFKAEAKGLNLLRSSNVISCPQAYFVGTFDGGAYLLLEWIEQGKSNLDFWEIFGKSLARMHRITNDSYGLDHDNFIGRLFQCNRTRSSGIDFIIEERLQAQFNKARHRGFFSKPIQKAFDGLCKSLDDHIPDESPSLIHGDLWSGNFLCSKEGMPVLIDPAVAFTHREFDLAMSKLFGGFHSEFYRSYQNEFPVERGFEERIGIFQLYYLLVHVNLFGASYVRSCEQIIGQYS